MTDEYTARQVAELKANPNVDQVYEAKMLTDQILYSVYDHSNPHVATLLMEKGEDVFVTVEHDGSWHINFLSIYPNTYHYKVTPFSALKDNDLVHLVKEHENV